MNGVLFFHNPRTAGVSIARRTGRILRNRFHHFKHKTVREVQLKHPGLFEYDFKFMFCRNPYARFVSSFYFVRNCKIPEENRTPELKFQAALQKILKTYDDFSYFCKNWALIKRSFNAQEHFRPQYIYAYDDHGNQMVDYVGRFERLDDDYRFLCNYFEIEAPDKLAHDNILPEKHPEWQDLYKRKEDFIVVEQNYNRDFELFGYQKLSEFL